MNTEKASVNCYAHGARYYDPQLARWHSPDPLSELYASSSPYGYVINNPINFVDPDGMRRDPAPYARDNYTSLLSDGYNRTPFENSFSFMRASGGWYYDNVTQTYSNFFGGQQKSAGDFNSDFNNNLISNFQGDVYTYEPWFQSISGKGMETTNGKFRGFMLSGISSGGESNNSDPLMDHHGDENFGTLEDFESYYDDWTLEEVISEQNSTTRLNSSSDGPYLRYIEDPVTGYVIDLKHMLMVGDAGTGPGLFVELIQLLTDRSSAFNLQDSFSNQLGYDFFFHYGSRINEEPQRFMEYFIRFFENPGLRGWIKY